MANVALISEYMTKDLSTLNPEMEINHAMNILLEKRISGAPVIDENGKLVGILSKKDCLKAALDASYYRDWGKTVADHMSKNIETLNSSIDIVEAASIFLESRFRRFPVMENNQLVGQISRADVLRAMKENWE
jgi:predicted transcriptional regulator